MSQGQGRQDHSEESRSYSPKEKRSLVWEETIRWRDQTERSWEKEIKGSAKAPVKVVDEDQTDFAAKLKGGLNYSLDSKSFIQGDYGFNFVNSSIENYTSDFTAHSFNAKFVINF